MTEPVFSPADVEAMLARIDVMIDALQGGTVPGLRKLQKLFEDLRPCAHHREIVARSMLMYAEMCSEGCPAGLPAFQELLKLGLFDSVIAAIQRFSDDAEIIGACFVLLDINLNGKK